MRIVDAHHHLWDPAALDYRLLSELPQLGPLRQAYTADRFASVAVANGVSGSVCIEAASAGANGSLEGAWLLGEVRRVPIHSRVVMWAPIESPSLGEYLDGILRAGRDRIAGIRRSFEFTPDGFASSPAVVAGVRTLAAYDLPFDLVLYADRLPEVADLVRRCPEVQFVLDHMGKPSIRDGRIDPWRADLAALARLPNVVCKISGLVNEASFAAWDAASLRPYVDHAVASFGWERLLFGSDWPVCELAGGYARWLEAARELTADASPDDQAEFFAGTAVRTYRL